jgi:hypothetical protein
VWLIYFIQEHGPSLLYHQRLTSYTHSTLFKMALDQYTYVFAIGTFFALLDAYNNGASKYRSL